MRRFIRIGVVTAWAEGDWHSERLLAVCRRRCEATAVDPAELSAWVGPGGVEVAAGAVPLGDLDGFILVRGLGRGGDPDLQFEIYRVLEESGAVVVNRLGPLLAAQDKFRTSRILARAGVPTPPAAVVQTADEARRALGAMSGAVAKPLTGSLGEGVERLAADAAGVRRAAQRVEREGALYLQAYVPHPGRDLRVFVVGGLPRAAIVRRARRGEWRTNVAQGGRVEPARCSAAVREAAVEAAAALGLDYAGVDLVDGPTGPTVLEVNGNPSWLGILEATGLDMAEAIADHVLGKALRRRRDGGCVARERMGATNG